MEGKSKLVAASRVSEVDGEPLELIDHFAYLRYMLKEQCASELEVRRQAIAIIHQVKLKWYKMHNSYTDERINAVGRQVQEEDSKSDVWDSENYICKKKWASTKLW